MTGFLSITKMGSVISIKQPIGKNKFASLPKQIAKFLKLLNAEDYTGKHFI